MYSSLDAGSSPSPESFSLRRSSNRALRSTEIPPPPLAAAPGAATPREALGWAAPRAPVLGASRAQPAREAGRGAGAACPGEGEPLNLWCQALNL